MRFDSHEHLEAWRTTGAFPKIHDAITHMAISELTGRRLLDLGCSYGLIGTRLLGHKLADIAIGIEVDAGAIKAAQEAGVPVQINHLKVEPGSFPEVLAIIRAHRLDVVIARRILPELFGVDRAAGKVFAHLLARAGVKEMIVEGRIATKAATNGLPSIDHEVDMLSAAFKERRRVGAVSYLTAR